MSKIKTVIIASYYSAFLDKFNKTQIGSDDSYSSQFKKLMDSLFAWSDFFENNLNKTGRYETVQFIINAEKMQKKWASEQNFNYDQSNWMFDILFEQVSRINPEFVFVDDLDFTTSKEIRLLKQKCPNIKLVTVWDGIDYPDKSRFEEFDVVVSCVKEICQKYDLIGKKNYLFQFGFETSILDRIQKSKNIEHDISFVGSLYLSGKFYGSRLNLLSSIANEFEPSYWLSSFDSNKYRFLKSFIKPLMKSQFSNVQKALKLSQINRGEAFGSEMYQVLLDSKITINTHGDVVKKYAGNMRLFEAPGTGCCLVTDWKENITDFYEPDKEVVTYKSIPECLEKIRFLLNNESVRKNIAKAGQEKVMREFSFEKRVNQFAMFAEKFF